MERFEDQLQRLLNPLIQLPKILAASRQRDVDFVLEELGVETSGKLVGKLRFRFTLEDAKPCLVESGQHVPGQVQLGPQRQRGLDRPVETAREDPGKRYRSETEEQYLPLPIAERAQWPVLLPLDEAASIPIGFAVPRQ